MTLSSCWLDTVILLASAGSSGVDATRRDSLSAWTKEHHGMTLALARLQYGLLAGVSCKMHMRDLQFS